MDWADTAPPATSTNANTNVKNSDLRTKHTSIFIIARAVPHLKRAKHIVNSPKTARFLPVFSNDIYLWQPVFPRRGSLQHPGRRLIRRVGRRSFFAVVHGTDRKSVV